MSEIKSTDPRIIELIKGLGIETEFLKELHIHIVPDDMVMAEAIYYLEAITEIDIDKAQTIMKKYRMEQIEYIPLTLGCKVRIYPAFESDNDRGRSYFVTTIDTDSKRVLLKYSNLTVISSPFWMPISQVYVVPNDTN